MVFGNCAVIVMFSSLHKVKKKVFKNIHSFEAPRGSVFPVSGHVDLVTQANPSHMPKVCRHQIGQSGPAD